MHVIVQEYSNMIFKSAYSLLPKRLENYKLAA